MLKKITPVTLLGKAFDSLFLGNPVTVTTPTGNKTTVETIVFNSSEFQPNQKPNFMAIDGYKRKVVLENPTSTTYQDLHNAAIEALGVSVVA